ncbi:MAG TPA: hypothetical protein VGO76_00620 [Luteibacter sp.]|jgi:hypothetical protein|nr:hypothetical protein [Luteibacter sp.]
MGVVGSRLPGSFAIFAAYADLATGLLAILALLTVRVRPLFWFSVVAFNGVGMADLVFDYYHAVHADLPAMAGELGAAYVIPIIYVPLLMITHIAAFYMLLRRSARRASLEAGPEANHDVHELQLCLLCAQPLEVLLNMTAPPWPHSRPHLNE